ncbi:MAG: hypothetical protein ACTIJ9_16255 [Aequorivita sp.]
MTSFNTKKVYFQLIGTHSMYNKINDSR